MDWNPNLELRGPLVVARPYGPGDGEDLFRAVRESHLELGRWMPWCHAEYERAESEKWVAECEQRWRRGESFDFALFDGRTGTFSGGAGINWIQVENRLGNLGYWVRTSQSGRGIATEAVRLLAGFGFDAVGLERIEIVVAEGNHASLRVAEKAGARREAVLRRRLHVREKGHDAVMFCLLREHRPNGQPAC